MQGTTPTLNRLLKARELAETWEEPTWKVYECVREHGLPAIRFGRALRFDPVAVQRWLDNGGTASRAGDRSTVNGNRDK